MDKVDLSTRARAYIATVVVAGAIVVGQSIHQLIVAPVGSQWFILVALTLLTGSFTIGISVFPARVSVSETFVFASVLLFGTAAGTITVVLETLVMSFWLQPRNRSPHRVLFNVAATAIAIWTSGTAFYLLSGISPYSVRDTPLPLLFLPLGAFTTLYFLLNTWLIAFALAFEKGRSPWSVWWPHFTWVSANYFSGASVAALIVTYTHEIDISTLAVIVPLLVITYLTFRTAMGRVDDSNKHLAQLNRLYLSTVETLAMAIDAKDQITHGHIRRVQTYAIGLARKIGVVDDDLIKAIEAASLLHDTGKLAVPEYILNKPGRLTSGEFDKMKLHASVGADILSAVDFPYPVVPIVRHHHENWDGTGYPSGLRGTDIPIGARILAVVDCFDALTSDRPYRPSLDVQDALQVLIERRGTMYDPLVVDTFVRVHEQIAPEAAPFGVPTTALTEITSSVQQSTRETQDHVGLDHLAESAQKIQTMCDLARVLSGQADISDTGDIISKHLRQLVPCSTLVAYLYDGADDSLQARYATGEASAKILGSRISVGQKLTGWVAANRRSIMNSDPALDLGETAIRNTPTLRSCLSAPLLQGESLIGVLTLHSALTNAFTEDHRRIVEVVGQRIASAFQSAAEFEATSRRDHLTGLPGIAQLEQLIAQNPGGTPSLRLGSVLLFIDVVGLRDINARNGRAMGDVVLQHVIRRVRAALRISDTLFRHEDSALVALLNDPTPEGVKTAAKRIRENVRQDPIGTLNATVSVDVTVAALFTSEPGLALHDVAGAGRVILAGPGMATHPNLH